mgnify:CR=1 FL=1
MPAAPSMGFLGQVGMGPDTGNVTESYEIEAESVGMQQEEIAIYGIRGTRSRITERVIDGRRQVGGSITLAPQPGELRKLLPRILGGAETPVSNTHFTYALAETLPSFALMIDRIAKVFTYATCYVDSASFSSATGQALRLALQIEALAESVGAAGTFPAISVSDDQPFVFHQGTLTLGGTAYEMMGVEVTLNNMLKKDRFVNSQTRTHLPPTDRQVSVRCTVPYTADTVGLYNSGAPGITGVVKFSVGGAGEGAAGKSLTFTFGKVILPAARSPVLANKDEIVLTLGGDSRKVTGSTPELAIILDTTA